MANIEEFVMSGSDKDLLISILDFITPLLESPKISINAFYIDDGILVFCKCSENELKKQDSNYKPYPFTVNSIVLAEQIMDYINNLDDRTLEKLNAIPNGYEEDYEIGWYLFKPDWYSDNHRIQNYNYGTTVLAVKPQLIEYGK